MSTYLVTTEDGRVYEVASGSAQDALKAAASIQRSLRRQVGADTQQVAARSVRRVEGAVWR